MNEPAMNKYDSLKSIENPIINYFNSRPVSLDFKEDSWVMSHRKYHISPVAKPE